MGDYTKVIVNCNIKEPENLDEFKSEFHDMIEMNSSAYHCGGGLLEFTREWDDLSVTMVTQLKYSRGLAEFIEWFRPFVIQGMGEEDVFAMSFTEYQTEPTLYRMEE